MLSAAVRRIPRAVPRASQPAARRFAAVPIVPIIGAFLAKKAVASYAIFNAVHSYGIPKLFRQVAHATRAWGVDAAARREFLYLVKGALRAPTSAYSFVENSFAARVVAHVAQNPELRAELNKRVPPVIVEAQSAVRRTPVGKATRRWRPGKRHDQRRGHIVLCN